MEISEKKAQFRSDAREVLRRISDKENRSFVLLERLQQEPLFQKASIVSLFISMPDEVLTDSIAQYCWKNGIGVGVPLFEPHLEASPVIRHRQWNESAQMESVHAGILQPIEGADIALDEIDLVLVPGLAFCQDGRRLGRGVGFYDRFLSQFKGSSIGLCFQEQLVSELPWEEHDRKVDFVISC
ncbi:MAG: 5-formyltetrahydrofolate cyclo-ligase [bacterium]|nr:5-formyltetrahydrofolate cyclo-ligase [bacterium]